MTERDRLPAGRRHRPRGDRRGACACSRAAARAGDRALPFGGAAIDGLGDRCPTETLEACRGADAVLLGAVGGPRWDGGAVRPEAGTDRAAQGARRLREPASGEARRRRPRRSSASSSAASTSARAAFARTELRSTRCEYHPSQIERIARRGVRARAQPLRSLVSVDKANVLETSRLWRRVVTRARRRLPGRRVAPRARRQLRDGARDRRRRRVDVVVTENTFGDILSDIAAAVTGGLGLGRLGEPRRRRAGDLRARARLGARHRRHACGQPGRDAALARAAARARARRAPRSSSASTRARRDRRASAAARPQRVGDAVLALEAELGGNASDHAPSSATRCTSQADRRAQRDVCAAGRRAQVRSR